MFEMEFSFPSLREPLEGEKTKNRRKKESELILDSWHLLIGSFHVKLKPASDLRRALRQCDLIQLQGFEFCYSLKSSQIVGGVAEWLKAPAWKECRVEFFFA